MQTLSDQLLGSAVVHSSECLAVPVYEALVSV